MSLRFRDEPDFGGAVEAAAKANGLSDPAFVEKDYWVTELLRFLAAEYPHDITFKGGTSLSKGYGIIKRFSEDVDILVLPDRGSSNREREAKLLVITERASKHLALRWEEHRRPGRGRHASRGDLIVYESVFHAITSAIVQDGVLLETGYGDGHEPKEVAKIRPLVADVLGEEADDYVDTSLFAIGVLEPRRTLIEKLYAVHHAGSHFLEEGGNLPRIGRHFYDIFQLLDHRDTIEKLKRERERFESLCGEVERISAVRFGGVTQRPAGGLCFRRPWSPWQEAG